MYQYVTETDGSVSTYQFDGVVFKLASAGTWKGDCQREAEAGILCDQEEAHLMTPRKPLYARRSRVIHGD